MTKIIVLLALFLGAGSLIKAQEPIMDKRGLSNNLSPFPVSFSFVCGKYASGTYKVGVKVSLKEGWGIYSCYQDKGMPGEGSSVQWTSHDKVDIAYPFWVMEEGVKRNDGVSDTVGDKLPNYFRDTVTFTQMIRKTGSKPMEITLQFTYQVFNWAETTSSAVLRHTFILQ